MKLPSGATLTTDPELVVVTISVPQDNSADIEAAEAEAAEQAAGSEAAAEATAGE